MAKLHKILQRLPYCVKSRGAKIASRHIFIVFNLPPNGTGAFSAILNKGKENMAKILIFSRTYSSSVSSVVEKNIQAFCKSNKNISYVFCEEEKVTYADIASCDSIICVRGGESTTLRILETAKRLGKFLVYFLDDDLLNIPSDIDVMIDHYYYFPSTRARLRACIALCDVLWSHNPNILKIYGNLTKGRKVCTDMYADLRPLPNISSKTFNVLFAGSVTHKKMLESFVLPAIEKLSKEFEEEVTFTFIGPKIEIKGKNIKKYPYFDNYEAFNRFIRSKRYHLGIAAVADREFDSCKYFVKFFDYSSLGAAGLYSNVMPYTMVVKDGVNGFTTENTVECWYEKIKYAITHPKECELCAKQARELIASRFNVTEVSSAIAETMPELLKTHGVNLKQKEILRIKYKYFPNEVLPKPQNMGFKEKLIYYGKKASLLWKTLGVRAFPLICIKACKKVFRLVLRKIKTFFWLRKKYGLSGVFKAVGNKLRRRELLFGLDDAFVPPSPAQKHIDYSARGRAIFTAQQSEFSREALHAAVNSLSYRPRISIAMPLYNAPIKWLKVALRSLQSQIYTDWQLCAVDDGSKNKKAAVFMKRAAKKDSRICFRQNEKNRGISCTLNDCISLATGDYIALMDQDDELTADALFWIAQEIVKHPNASLIYSDECKKSSVGEGELFDFYLKPDWSPELLLSHMYTSHLSVYRKQYILDIGGFRSEYDFAQDYDLALRTVAAGVEVRHVRRILYFWRAIPTSGAAGGKDFARQNCIRALKSFTESFVKNARILCLPSSNYPAIPFDRQQKVSVIIPSDNLNTLKTCITQLIENTNYKNLQIVPVTNSTVADKLQKLHWNREVLICRYDKPFNFSDKCNEGGKIADGETLVFYNDDVTPYRRDWLNRLLEMLQIPGVGAVSPMLLQKDEQTIQYAGMIAGTPGICGTAFNNFESTKLEQSTFHHMLIRNVSILSGACFAIKKSIFTDTFFDAEHTPNGNSDVDFSFRLLEKGLRCVYNPYSVVVHIGNHSWRPKKKADKSDIFMLKRWETYLEEDAYFPDPLKNQLYEDFRYLYKIYPPRPDTKKNTVGKDILFVTHELTRTGAPTVLIRLVDLALSRGDSPIVLSFEDGPLREVLCNIGVTVILDESSANGSWLFKRFARNFDLVIANTLACAKAVEALNGDICPVLWWIHESKLAFDIFAPILPAKLHSNIHVYVAWEIISESLATVYGKRNYPLLPCGIDQPSASNVNILDKRKIFICVGSIEPRKGQSLFAKAISLLSHEEQKKCAFYFIGKIIDPHYLDKEILPILSNIKGCEIKFLESMPKEQLFDLYHKSYCIVVPSEDDPGPLIPIEAMSMNKPSIISDACGASRCIYDGMDGIIFRSGDAFHLKEKLLWALSNEQEMLRIGANARKLYDQEFSADIFNRKANKILDELLCKK